MPFERPTLTGLREQARDDFNASLPGADSRLRHSNLRVIGDVLAALVHGLYGYLDYQYRQLIVDTADGEHLERHAAIYDIARKAAAIASGDVTVTGTEGSAVPAGTDLQAANGGVFSVAASATIAGGSATVAVEASNPGAAGNLDAGATLAFVAALAGVDATAVVAAGGLTGGADEESDTSLRARVLERIRTPPHGGSRADYVSWAREVPGVTRAWVAPAEMGPGTVTVRFMMDTVRAAQNGIPQGDGAPDYTGDLADVYEHIDGVRPVTADVYVAAPEAEPLDLTIADLTPDTPEIRTAIEAELQALLLREAAPGATIHLSQIYEAVSIATGERHHRIASPASDKTHTAGQIAVPGTVTYTS